jgi:succinate dehydrogenase / fumarate reductase cytochrome b subunit
MLQRVSGLLLAGYLFFHLGVINLSLAGAETFDTVTKWVQHPVFTVLDNLLIALVLYHAINGVRVMLLETGFGLRRQASMFWISIAATAGIAAYMLYLNIPLIFR